MFQMLSAVLFPGKRAAVLMAINSSCKSTDDVYKNYLNRRKLPRKNKKILSAQSNNLHELNILSNMFVFQNVASISRSSKDSPI